MLKDIYIIRNDVNDKVYIGQAKNTNKRFINHLNRAKTNADHSPIHDAINKIGKEHFFVEILEHQIENYNEREKYWIKSYNSMIPNGYNLLEGGENPPYHSGEDCYNSLLKNKEVEQIQDLLLNTTESLSEIAKRFNITWSNIRHINYGESWFNEELNYPLRKKDGRELIFSEEKFSMICWLLKKSTCSFEDIGTYFSTNRKSISRINNGKSNYHDNITYPIRTKRRQKTETVEEALKRGGLL